MTEENLRTLFAVAKGLVEADLVIKNARIVDVFTESIQDGVSLAIKDGFIALMEKGSLPGRHVIDASGLFLCPGFIDAHTHLDSLFSFQEFVPYALKGGATTVITECAMVACSCGIKGVEAFLQSTEGHPLRCFFVAPPLTPPFPHAEGCKGITFQQFKRLLRHPRALGVGEAYWTRIVEGDKRIIRQAALALSLKKRLDGHASGAKGRKLAQYIATGITSCHESVKVDEALEKMRNGVYVMIREGFVRRELDELAPLRELKDKRRLILVSDSFDATMLLEGYMDRVVKRAIDVGFSPIEAIKMATLNPADYHDLRDLGAIAPLRKADILFLSDLETVRIEKVMFEGRIVFSEGRFVGELGHFSYPKDLERTIHSGPFEEADFTIEAPIGARGVRVIEVVNETITKERRLLGIPDEDRMRKEDIAICSVINRQKGKRYSLGFVKGTGIREGAVATTLTWDTGNILAIGSSAMEIKTAVERIRQVQGGYVVARDGKIIFELPMPVFGLLSKERMGHIAERSREFEKAVRAIGCTLTRPFLTLQVIPFTGLPFLRITDRGLFDVREKRLLSPFLFSEEV